MKAKYKKLAREQLDVSLRGFEPLKNLAVPDKGWVRAIRDALGMTGEQLARRMGVNQQRVARIEHDERPGNVTINTMRNTAEALDCVFVYCLVPKDSLENIVRRRAKILAHKLMEQSSQTMMLEKQGLSFTEKSKSLDALTDDIINSMPKSLWDE
jgi:predicted DNA-binding mobile mystery protein A